MFLARMLLRRARVWTRTKWGRWKPITNAADVLDMLRIEVAGSRFRTSFCTLRKGSSLLVSGLDLIDHFPIDGY